MGTDLARAPIPVRPARVEPEVARPAPAPVRPVAIPALTVGSAADAAEFDAERRAQVALSRLTAHPHPVRRSPVPAPAAEIGGAGGTVPARLAGEIQGRRGGGAPLTADVRQRMETAFDADFGGVRVHTDAAAARLNRSMSAAAFTTGRDIFFGAGHYRPDTAEGEHVLAHELAHTLQPDQVSVRRRFLSAETGQVLSFETVWDQVKTDADVCARLAKTAGAPNPGHAVQIVKMLGGGPDIRFARPADLLLPTEQMIAVSPQFFLKKTGRTVRRRVRIAALMNQRIDALAGSKNDFVRYLAGQVGPLLVPSDEPARAQKEMIRLIGEAQAEWRKDNRHVWLAFQLLSQFGPLSHQLLEEANVDPDSDVLNQLISQQLRELRMVMLAKQNVGVVAHRGAGPTNRTMGSLIDQRDARRTARPAENSPEAFETALAHASTTPENAGLDGVECDVFLSADGVAIVTHEAKLSEQLSTARQQAFAGSDLVYERKAAEILGIQRTDRPGSGFMTLRALLYQVLPVARHYYEATGRPFRMEIEMKGSAPGHGADKQSYEDKIPEQTKKNLGHGGNYLRVVVARQISQMKKALVDVPMEFALFNGQESSAKDFAATRRRKVALGDITVGVGRGPADREPALGPHGNDVDEVRFSLASALANVPWMTRTSATYIMTGVFGQEFAPLSLPALRAVEPSVDLEPRSGKEKDRGTEIASALRDRGRRPTKDERNLADLVTALKRKEVDITHFRLLTDYPAKAAYLKTVIGEVVNPPQPTTSAEKATTAVDPDSKSSGIDTD